MENKTFYTVREIADKLGITTYAVRSYIYSGRLKATKFNGAYIIDKAVAEEFIKQRSA